jgi:hypothetical protein
MRHGLGDGWSTLTAEQTDEVRWLLGALWDYLPHAAWDELHYGNLDLTAIERLIVLAQELRSRARPAEEILEEADKLAQSAA